MIRAFAMRFLGEPDPHTRLIQREMLEPSFALDAIVREFMRPRFRALLACLAVLLPRASQRELELHGLSVIGQLLHYKAARPVIQRLVGASRYTPAFIEEVVAHVTDFTERALGLEPPRRARRKERRP
jgi:hypothetical protein